LTPAIAELLAAKAAEVDAEIAALTVPLESGGVIQFGKRAGDSTAVAAEQLSRVSAHEQLLALAADIARAREKVADGSYGVCDACGSPVGDERLEALPWAVRCVRCASAKRR
jgi:RNA polymerase-binding transcription factor DksA